MATECDDGCAEFPERTRLLSNDLLDELGPGTPPGEVAYRVPGTPSDPGSPPCPIHHSNLYGARVKQTFESAPSNFWDWKTDVPEFVPGGSTGTLPFRPSSTTSASPPFTSSVKPTPTPMVSNMWAVTPAAIPSGASIANSNAERWLNMMPVGVAGSDTASLGNVASNEGDEVAMRQVRAQYEVQVQRQNEEFRLLQQRMNKLERVRSEVKEKWESERQELIREISRYVGVLTRYAIPLEEACEGLEDVADWCNVEESDWKVDSGLTNGSKLGSVGKALSPSTASLSLDAKMKKLNGLLFSDVPTKNSDNCMSIQSDDDSAAHPGVVVSTLQAMFPHAMVRTQNDEEEDYENDMRPIVNMDKPLPVNNKNEEAEESTIVLENADVREHAEKLERLTSSIIDDRAMRALQGLSPSDAFEVLRKVDDLVEAQGGRCRNLSSILQSVCRKLERRNASRSGGDVSRLTEVDAAEVERRRSKADRREEDGLVDAAGSDVEDADSGDGDDGTTRKRRRKPRKRRGARAGESDGEVDPKCEIDQDCDGNNEAAHADCSETVSSRRRRRRRGRGTENSDADDRNSASGAEDPQQGNVDLSSGGTRRERRQRQSGKVVEALAAINIFDEDVPKSSSSAVGATNEYWTTRRVEREANKGFELKWKGDYWQLELSMASVDPPWSDAAMERYCAWLRRRLASIREEHGFQVLRKCCGDIDFSGNALGDKGVWMLLEVLSQCEVHAAYMKFQNNAIAQGGALAICEFVRTNKRAQSVYELHLSHNEIDDDSAFELLRTLHIQRGRYPPRRYWEGGGSSLAPVWVHLSYNRIRDPTACLRGLEAEGISYCTSRNWDGRGECPVVQLYQFADQTPRRRFRGREPREETWEAEPDEAWAAWTGSSAKAGSSWNYDDDGDDYEDTGRGSRRRRNRKPRRGYGNDSVIQHQ